MDWVSRGVSLGVSKILGWFLAGLLGGVIAIAGQRLFAPPSPEPLVEEVAVVETPAISPLPQPILDIAVAREVVLSVLTRAGVSPDSIRLGKYPLLGDGRRAWETLPLISFTCPVTHACSALFDAIGAAGRGQGFQLVHHEQGDRPNRALFRALAQNGRPALAIRAFPPGPRLSLVVGEVGREPALLDALLALDPDVTFAVSAGAPHADEVAQRLGEKGREVIAQLPMDPQTSGDLHGPNYLSVSMTPNTVRETTANLMARVPGAVGINGYPGGVLTASRPHMDAVFSVIGDKGLFFLERQSTVDSVAIAAARDKGERTAVKTHVLESSTQGLLARLRAVEVALVLDGHALVMARPSPEVLAELRTWLDGLRDRKINLLRLSEVVL